MPPSGRHASLSFDSILVRSIKAELKRILFYDEKINY